VEICADFAVAIDDSGANPAKRWAVCLEKAGRCHWRRHGQCSGAKRDRQRRPECCASGLLRMRRSNFGQLQTSTGTISTLSDARLKDQVVDYAGALDQINALRSVRYHYRDAGKAAFQAEGLHLGFVAQEFALGVPGMGKRRRGRLSAAVDAWI